MAQMIIEHPDGRRYEVSDTAFADLYEPFGFQSQGIVFQGAMIPDSPENRARADEVYGQDLNDSPLNRENRARAVILADLEDEARRKIAFESTVEPGTAQTPTVSVNAEPVSSPVAASLDAEATPAPTALEGSSETPAEAVVPELVVPEAAAPARKAKG